MSMEEALINGLHNGFAIVGALFICLWLVWGRGVIDRAERFAILKELAGHLMDDYETVCERNETLEKELSSLKDRKGDPPN